jgi:hypothetical protein
MQHPPQQVPQQHAKISLTHLKNKRERPSDMMPRNKNTINSLSGSNKHLLSDELIKQPSKAVSFKQSFLDRITASEKI